MKLPRLLGWLAAAVVAPFLLLFLFIAIFGWAWLRGPIESITAQKTGRVLAIKGDLAVHFGWPVARIGSGAVTFANPAWAREKQMLAADGVEIAIDLRQLLLRRVVLPEVRLERPLVFLEQDGERRNWLMDTQQSDE